MPQGGVVSDKLTWGEQGSKVTRLLGRKYDGRINDARGRKLVITVEPNGLIGLRPQGLGYKRTVYINAQDVYDIAFWRKAKA